MKKAMMKWSKFKNDIANIPRRYVVLIVGAALTFLTVSTLRSSSFPTILPTMPTISISYPSASVFNASKVALLIENRPLPHLAPHMLHMISVVPPDWRFRFMGSSESVRFINKSRAIQHQVESGKLDLTYIPANMSTEGQEQISQFLTNLWVYETLLAPAEWLLVWQTDSILCANSHSSLNSWLNFDWVGAPWSPVSRFGGNGGLSLRRVSSIVQILRHQLRLPGSQPEDVWLTDRLGHRPGAVVANGSLSLEFSGENVFTERPMGYHTGSSGSSLGGGIWGSPELRGKVYGYCPEIKMTLGEMDAAAYVEGSCHDYWKK